MKVQDVKKECTATVGLSVEFSNSEIGSLSKLLWVVDNAVDKGVESAHQIAVTQQQQFKDNDNVPVRIDLKSLKRIQWLLTQLTRNETSGLFEQTDADYHGDLSYINDIPVDRTEVFRQ